MSELHRWVGIDLHISLAIVHRGFLHAQGSTHATEGLVKLAQDATSLCLRHAAEGDLHLCLAATHLAIALTANQAAHIELLGEWVALDGDGALRQTILDIRG